MCVHRLFRCERRSLLKLRPPPSTRTKSVSWLVQGWGFSVVVHRNFPYFHLLDLSTFPRRASNCADNIAIRAVYSQQPRNLRGYDIFLRLQPFTRGSAPARQPELRRRSAPVRKPGRGNFKRLWTAVGDVLVLSLQRPEWKVRINFHPH